MKEIKYILGTQWGDEGKGKTVQYLCQEAINQGKKPLVIRYCSGPQASHTVIHDDITHVCSSFGSGVLFGVPTYINIDALIDPIALKAEYEILESKGIKPVYDFDFNCRLITPYDVIANRQNQESLSNGTCGCGVWETINRLDEDFSLKIPIYENDEEIYRTLGKISDFYGMDRNDELEASFVEALDFIIVRADPLLDLSDFNVYIMESSQGLLLDGEKGLKPHTTPCKITDYYPDDSEIYLCTRTYTTRHGAGYIPKESDYIKYPAFEANKDNQYQGQFKTGILDIDMINRAIDRHCLDNIENCKFNLVINHVDCVGSMFEYIYQGRIHVVPGFDAVTRIQNLINLKFDKVLIGKSPLSEFEVK